MSHPNNQRAISQRLTMLRMVFRKQIMLMFRYPVNLISGLLTMYVFFAMVFFGGQAVGSQAITESIEGIVVGFFLWTMAWGAFANLTWNVTREAQWGTLEQLFMNVHGFETLMTLKSIVNVLLSFLPGVVLLGLMLLTTGESLHIDVVTIVPIVLFGLISVIGVGFVFAGLAIIYKRIENIFQMLTFVLLGLIAAPAAEIPALKALPLVQSGYLLERAMADGVGLFDFALVELVILCVTAIGYFVIGIVFFRLAQTRARKLGVLGHY